MEGLLLLCLHLSSCAGTPPQNHARAAGLNPPKVLLKTTENRFVRLTEQTPNGQSLAANTLQVSDADTFYLVDLGNDIIGFQTLDGRYFSCFLHQDSALLARPVFIGNWEKFQRWYVDNDMVLQGVEGLFWSVNATNNYKISGSSDEAKLTLFHIIPVQ